MLASIFFPRFWCRYFCVSGALISLLNKFALLKNRFIRNYNNCPYEVKGRFDIRCLQCHVCVQEQDAVIRHGGDLLFKWVFAVVLFVFSLLMIVNMYVVPRQTVSEQTFTRSEAMATIDKERLEDLIARGRLSDHEAMFYEKVR